MAEILLNPALYAAIFATLTLAFIVLKSVHSVGPTEVGLITKRWSTKKLTDDNPIAFNGEAGYQAELLMPGLRFKFWPLYGVQKFPWVQVASDEIGVVIAQVGKPLPNGAKSAKYKKEFGNFSKVQEFLTGEGQKGVQRPVLPPGTLLPLHPVAFLVITQKKVFGLPVSPELRRYGKGELNCGAFGLTPDQLKLVRIQPMKEEGGKVTDIVGIVTTFEGDPLASGDIACRLGGFTDISEMEGRDCKDAELVEKVLGTKNDKHNNYQDFQAFLDAGGKIGLQHDPLLYGEYTLNPFLVKVDFVRMLVVKQGEVAVIKAYVGLPTEDTSGEQFKHGSIVKPGHRGIWQEPLRTGKYALNPRCYEAELVPTAILTLNWADATSKAHTLDQGLQQIVAKSNEGFVFKIDLQVQIHVPDAMAPKVISSVGTMHNLVNEVLQAAVGNHFRDKLQSMPAVDFIAKRQDVQSKANEHISAQLKDYKVETKGVYIQDVILPEELVKVLTEREIANQEIETFKKQKESEDQRVAMEMAKGTADMQADLARSKVGIDIKGNQAQSRQKEADGEAYYLNKVGEAKGAEIKAIGEAKAAGYQKQVDSLGKEATAIVNALEAIARSNTRLVPDVLVTGGGGATEGLAATLIKGLRSGGLLGGATVAASAAPAAVEPAPATRKEGPGNGATPKQA